MGNSPKSQKINAPKGTRDLYPEDLLRQRYITNAWRDASINCGFEEIAGPTFESTELYSVKSGDGILSELFQAFSGKSEKEIEQVQSTGQAPYALRPEFTPTLARMYAAKSKELPKPCKWFTAGPYFRAERPQRGRLREFLQWNVDVIGLPGDDNNQENRSRVDAEVIACATSMFRDLGLRNESVQIHLSSREIAASILIACGVKLDRVTEGMQLLDRWEKMSEDQRAENCDDSGLNKIVLDKLLSIAAEKGNSSISDTFSISLIDSQQALVDLTDINRIRSTSPEWFNFNPIIARGLAYYTGTVFEAIADGERAVAGGGRYDNLIELFGGPPTPACGFGMGDVVLGNLLDDKGLIPTGAQLMDTVAKPQASIRPIAFVVTSDESNDALVHTLVANLRRGIESESYQSRDDRKPWDRDRYETAPMHTRISYKSTRKVNKLADDAKKQHARFFIEIKAPDQVELTNMDTRESLGEFCIDPTHEKYVGRAIATRM